MPKGDADFYVNTNAHLEAKVARLMAQLAESQAREAKMREACAKAANWLSPTYEGSHEARKLCYEALALPSDDSAMREMIEAAKAEEREAIISEMPGGHSVDP